LKTIIEFEKNLDDFEPSERQNLFNKEVKLFFKKNLDKNITGNIFYKSNFILPNFFLEKFENSYKDIPDEKFQEVVDYINFLKENPS